MNLKARLSMLEKGSHEGHPLMIFVRNGQETPEQLQQIEEAEKNGRHVTIISTQRIEPDDSLIHKND